MLAVSWLAGFCADPFLARSRAGLVPEWQNATGEGVYIARASPPAVNCLLVGAGAIAEAYTADFESTDLSLAGVCDLDADRAAAIADDHEVPAFTDLETALAAVEAPLVLNLTSHAAHADVTEQALRAGRHVYSQKPLALDPERAADLVALARDRDLALGVAPANPDGPSQKRAARLLSDGRLGRVGLGYAYAHVGRVTEWHDRPESFLEIGPLYDGAVYPLTLLVAWFGPVERIRVADAVEVWPDREDRRPAGPSHVEATMDFASGPTVRLTASFYAPHRSREFYGLELHGDDGSLYLEGTGAMETAVDHVRFGRLGREYTAVPPQSPTTPQRYVDPVQALAESVRSESPDRRTGRRGAHVVAIIDAIERAAANGGPVGVPDAAVPRRPKPATDVSPDPNSDRLSLPPIGFGTSRYRDGRYVDRKESIATALDAGYRLLDTAELYGNEHRVGELLAAPGAPDRSAVFLLGKVWRTNHRREDMLAAAQGSLEELDIEAFDAYGLHWPEAWAHQGPLRRLAEKPVEEQEGLTFPETGEGEIETAPISLETAWRNLEAVADRGLARTIGVSNVDRAQLRRILSIAETPPAFVQIERHPYQPRQDLVEFCDERDIRVVAHSPLSAPGLLAEPVLQEIGAEQSLSPAGVVLAWNVGQGVVPIPSSTKTDHVVANLAAAAQRLTADQRRRIEGLADAEFER